MIFALRSILLAVVLVFAEVAHASWWDAPAVYHGNIQISTETLLSEINNGKRVLFVDTRELEEYEQSHIPTAQHLMLRDVNSAPLSKLAQYDYVVPYCLKDFRGYEVARRLMENGLSNVVMMEPSGLRGWQSLGLPLTGPSIGDDAAWKLLQTMPSVSH
jgi:phage shock protein E